MGISAVGIEIPIAVGVAIMNDTLSVDLKNYHSSPRASKSAKSLFLPISRLFKINCSRPI